jgi:predicted metal-binding membrane protein
MSARDFLNNVTVILFVMAIGAVIETAVPMFVARGWKHGRRAANLWLTATSFVANWLLASVAATAVLTLGRQA